MTTLFDRYVLSKFVHTYLILFVSTYGLFVVFDGFTNIDEFQSGSTSSVDTLVRMTLHYSYQASAFFGMIGAILGVISAMIVFALLQKHSEIHPMLAAGIPIYRIVAPALIGMAIVNVMLIVNQEIVIPNIAQKLLSPRNTNKTIQKHVEPIYDPNNIHIAGLNLLVNEQIIESAEFRFRANELTQNMIVVSADQALYQPETAEQASGWILTNVEPNVDRIVSQLTQKGRSIVSPLANGNGIFVQSGLNFLELYNRTQSSQYATTKELIKRVKSPASNPLMLRAQEMQLHIRLTSPMLNLLAILVAVPLVLRRESRGLIGNLAVCGVVLGILLAFAQGSFFLGRANLLEPDIAAWTPVLTTGGVAAWVSGYIQS